LAENFACGVKAAVDFLEQLPQALRGILGICFGGKLKTLCATKKPQLIFWNKFSPGITGEKAGRVFTLCKASSGYTRKNWIGFHTWNLIADSKQH
jgi:hypothetical protein